MFPERVRNTGTIEFLDDAGGNEACRCEGEVIVKLFGFGGRVEKMIVAEIVKSYEASAAFTREWLATR